jgi:D-alanine-D-alanine ligase
LKIAVIYNRVSEKVINLFGVSNREKYGLQAIKRITNGLKQGGHQVVAIEGDKDLVDNLEKFMPRVLKGERPGMALNLSYGIQGQARYTHVPGILEMVGIPYVGSGPLAHSLALDKVVAKMLFRQSDLPTPDFAVINDLNEELPTLTYPLIVKPRNEAVSFGIRIVNNEDELREAAANIFGHFAQSVLVEQYIEGREINVGILGNQPTEALPPAEITFGEGGPNIYTYEDKTRKSGREIGVTCPAPISEELAQQAQQIAIQAFNVLGCYDCARIDMRLDKDNNLYILEVNSLPSLGEHGSYVTAAAAIGLDFPALINRLVEVACARYFGTPTPPEFGKTAATSSDTVFLHLTQRRDRLEKRLEQWVGLSSRSDDPLGIQLACQQAGKFLEKLGLRINSDYDDKPYATTWETAKGFRDGTLIIAHMDTPLSTATSAEPFHRDPEWLYGEGVGSVRAPMVALEFALQALKQGRQLRNMKLGVLLYSDEGYEAQHSADMITKASAEAREVLVLRPGNAGERIITRRRGQRRFRLVVESKALRPGASSKQTDALSWLFPKLEKIIALSSREERTAVAVTNIKPEAYPLLLPHRVTVTLQVSFPSYNQVDQVEESIREVLGKSGPRWSLSLLTDRPPMKERKRNQTLVKCLKQVGEKWEIPVKTESSLWPSVAGLVPTEIPVICGLGPVATKLYTSREAVSRISLIQRTLLLAEFLLERSRAD